MIERLRAAWWGFKNPGERMGYETAIALSYENDRLREQVAMLEADVERLLGFLNTFDDPVTDTNEDEEYD